MTGVVNPCTPDCTERCCGCQLHCSHWAEYVAARNAGYDKALRRGSVNRDFWGVTTRSHGTPLVEAGRSGQRKIRHLR